MNSACTNSDLATILTTETFEQQSRLPLDQRFLWKIERGVVRTLTWSKEGIITTLGLWGPGDIIGKPLSQAVPYEAECFESVAIIPLPKRLWVHEMKAILLSAQQTENLLNIISDQQVRCRLLKFLNWLAHKFGYEVKTGRLITLQLTHQIIAETIRATRVTVTRAFSSLEKSGKIIRNNHQLILPYRYQDPDEHSNKRKLILTSYLNKIQV